MKKEYCFSVAVESEENVMAVHGAIVLALHNAGYEYQSVKEITAQEHWNRTTQQPTNKGQNA